MKTKLFLFSLLVLCTIVQAQASEPTFSKKSSWNIITTNLMDSTFLKIDTYTIGGDTLIEGKNYSKIYKNNKFYNALRETEDNKIYLYRHNEFPTGEYLTYDFDWYPNKPLYIQYPNSGGGIDSGAVVVLGSSIDSIQLLDGKFYQYVNIGGTSFGPKLLIRNIGDNFYPFGPFEFPTNGDQYALLCFYIDNRLVYSNPYFNYCFIAVEEIISVPVAAIAGTPLTLSGTVIPNDATYQNIVWSIYDEGTTGATITHNELNTTAQGTVVVTATVHYDVSGAVYTQNITIEVESVGIHESVQEFSNIKVYPNPSNDIVTVEFLENLRVNTFKIFNTAGSLVRTYELKGESKIEVQNLTKGVYVYTAIIKNNQKLSGKIIIQ